MTRAPAGAGLDSVRRIAPDVDADPAPDAPRPRLADPRRIAALRATGLLDSAPDDAFDRISRLVSRLLDVPVALVTLVDDERQFFKSAVGLDEPWATARETLLSHSFCQHVVDSDQPLVVSDTRGHPVVGDSPAVRDLRFVAYAGMPLRDGDGQPLGSLSAVDHRPRQWTDDDLQTLADLADALTSEIALRTAHRNATRAQERAEHAARPLVGLHTITRGLAGAESTEEILAVVMDDAMATVEAHACGVCLVEGDGTLRVVETRGVRGVEDGRRWQHIPSVNENPVVDALERGLARFFESRDELLGQHPTMALWAGDYEARAIVPVFDRDGTAFCALVFAWEEPRAFSATTRQFFESLSRVAAVAFERTRSIERERQSAATLQRSLLPRRLPQHEALDIKVTYLPASSGLMIGGDFFDAFHVDDDVIALAIGDVVGHELQAAASMAEIRHSLRAITVSSSSPCDAFLTLNRLVCRFATTMATAALITIDVESATLCYTSAGHPPALLREPDGRVRLLDAARGMIIGADMCARYPQAERSIEPGSLIVLYTDGLIERRSESIDQGIQRMVEVVSDLPLEITAEEARSEIVGILEPRAVEDDIAVMVAVYRGS